MGMQSTGVSADTKIEILHEHYKETCEIIQGYIRLRYQLLFYILVLIALMSFQIFFPTQSGDTISEFLSTKLELTTPLDVTVIGTAIWFGLLALVIRYFQTVVYVERLYSYLHNLEDQLSPVYKGQAFTREGKSYLGNHPLILDWVSLLYSVIFPALLIAIVVIKIAREYKDAVGDPLTLLLNIIFAICIIVSSSLFMFFMRQKKS